MVTPEKIEEWLKEAEERPESAGLLLKYIANRLRDLTARNEELMAENIALQNGQKIEEYEKQISHLEYELTLLKRRFGQGLPVTSEDNLPEIISLLVYDLRGRVLRIEVSPDDFTALAIIGNIKGELLTYAEPPRLLAVPSAEELLFLYTSGRVSTHPVVGIPPLDFSGGLKMEQAALPDDSHPGERLVSLAAFSGLPMADYYLQVSRRGCVKKTMTSITESVLSNHFIGRGAIQKADQPFEIMLCHKKDLLVLVTWEGQLFCLDVDELTYAVEERLHLSPTDHVIAGFTIQPIESILLLTQTGKVILRTAGILEPARTPNAKGISLIPPTRHEQGVRAIGAIPTLESSRILVLHGNGNLVSYAVEDLSRSGSIQQEDELLAVTSLPHSSKIE